QHAADPVQKKRRQQQAQATQKQLLMQERLQATQKQLLMQERLQATQKAERQRTALHLRSALWDRAQEALLFTVSQYRTARRSLSTRSTPQAVSTAIRSNISSRMMRTTPRRL